MRSSTAETVKPAANSPIWRAGDAVPTREPLAAKTDCTVALMLPNAISSAELALE